MGTVFDGVVEEYDAGRPGYPDALYDAVVELSGVAFARAVVVDVGAGTGISTRGLLERGARVVAVERGGRMLGRLVARTPRGGVGAVLGDGNALPVRDGVADLVTWAQSWHWLDPVVSVAEARRVLRPGGAMATWWNTVDPESADWLAAYEVRQAEACPAYRGPALEDWGPPPSAAAMAEAGLAPAVRWIPWRRVIGLEDFLLDMRSHSWVASMPAEEVEALVARQRTELGRVFPGGVLDVPMRVYLVVGRTPEEGG
ncbi:class I SAM-dependent methyltransferase [Thermocatellispora tengchongensis]|uniref:class I SAM-dependent methyltransferase n=1 Tax=Thermocatellispora tengchongensis TaxID=1073253 RepID=UPI0031ED8870